jgi:hypothetical protein
VPALTIPIAMRNNVRITPRIRKIVKLLMNCWSLILLAMQGVLREPFNDQWISNLKPEIILKSCLFRARKSSSLALERRLYAR